MRGIKYFLSLLIILFLITSSFSTINVISKEVTTRDTSNDFYFIHITDTHVLHKDFDEQEKSKKRLTSALEKIRDFSSKPAFVIITGDLVEWGGDSSSGSLNFQTFVDCFYESDARFYADAEFTIPVYFTPGNHDYRNNLLNPLDIDKELSNYHLYIGDVYEENNDNYVINYDETSLFFLNSGPDYLEDPSDWARVLGDGLYDEDIEWLKNNLNDSEAKNKIILMHHPAVNNRDEFGKMIDVIARNRQSFIDLCLSYDVEMILSGHTHRSIIYDSEEKKYSDLPLDCSMYQTLFIQTDDCKKGCHYRNISYINGDFIIGKTKEISFTSKPKNKVNDYPFIFNYDKKLVRVNLLLSILLRLVNANPNLKF